MRGRTYGQGQASAVVEVGISAQAGGEGMGMGYTRERGIRAYHQMRARVGVWE